MEVYHKSRRSAKRVTSGTIPALSPGGVSALILFSLFPLLFSLVFLFFFFPPSFSKRLERCIVTDDITVSPLALYTSHARARARAFLAPSISDAVRR